MKIHRRALIVVAAAASLFPSAAHQYECAADEELTPKGRIQGNITYIKANRVHNKIDSGNSARLTLDDFTIVLGPWSHSSTEFTLDSGGVLYAWEDDGSGNNYYVICEDTNDETECPVYNSEPECEAVDTTTTTTTSTTTSTLPDTTTTTTSTTPEYFYFLADLGDGTCPSGSEGVPESECLAAGHEAGAGLDLEDGLNVFFSQYSPCGCFLWHDPIVGFFSTVNYNTATTSCEPDEVTQVICKSSEVPDTTTSTTTTTTTSTQNYVMPVYEGVDSPPRTVEVGSTHFIVARVLGDVEWVFLQMTLPSGAIGTNSAEYESPVWTSTMPFSFTEDVLEYQHEPYHLQVTIHPLDPNGTPQVIDHMICTSPLLFNEATEKCMMPSGGSRSSLEE